jgi:hypothetical protein
MEELEKHLPACRISHDERAGDGKWIVAVHDILESDLETAPVVERPGDVNTL